MAKSKVVNIKAAKKNKRKHEKNKSLEKKQKQKQKKNKVALTPEEKEKALKRRLITIVIVILLIIAAGYSIYKIGVLQVEKHNLDEQNMDLRREKTLLEEELKNVQDLEYVEEEAREKLNLIMPGEVIYRFSDDEKGK